MRKFLVAGVAVLALVSAANAFVLSIDMPNVTGMGTAETVVPILIKAAVPDDGAPVIGNVASSTLTLSLDKGDFVSATYAGGIFAAQTNTPEMSFFDNAAGLGTNDGFYCDFGLNPGTFAAAEGKLITLTLNTTGVVMPLNISFASDWGGTLVTTAMAGDLDISGTVLSLPEPAALALLALGGLFIRRRHA